VLSFITVVSTLGLAVYLQRINDAAPFPDAFTTVLSLVGQYLLTKKVIENWHVWILADVLYIFMYIRRELFLTSVLYGIFLLMCIAGLVEWRRTFRGYLLASGEPSV
jgi:nicotinamide mononucleotide transporter